MCSRWNEANGPMKRTATGFFVLALLLSVLALTCTGCDSLTKSEAENILSQIDALTGDTEPTPAPPITESLETGTETDAVDTDTTPLAPSDTPAEPAIFKDEYYYDLTHVVLYIDAYDCLPENYITKSEAEALGWSGGSVEVYKEGAAIGGDTFGNREKLLPTGITYTECDLDTYGADSRGPCRLVFGKENGEYRCYYTADHYSSFSEVYIDTNGEVTYR